MADLYCHMADTNKQIVVLLSNYHVNYSKTATALKAIIIQGMYDYCMLNNGTFIDHTHLGKILRSCSTI